MQASTASVQDTGPIQSRYRFIQEKAEVVIVKFPKIPLLYTLKEKEGHRLFFVEEEFCNWIANDLMLQPLMDARPLTSFSQQKSIFYQKKIDHEPV